MDMDEAYCNWLASKEAWNDGAMHVPHAIRGASLRSMILRNIGDTYFFQIIYSRVFKITFLLHN